MLLLAVGLLQLWLAARHELSPWCGGGFGMFSTTDGWGARHLHATALSPAFRAPLEIPRAREDDLERALALPTDTHLGALARALVDSAPNDLEPPHSIRIDVFARRHDPRTLAPEGKLLRSFELRLTPHL